MADQIDPLAQGITGLPPQPVQDLGKATLSGLGGAFSTALDMPRQVMQQSENLRTTGQYDPAPMVNLLQMMSLGGMGAAEPGMAGIFGGQLAKTANLAKLEEAKNLAARGFDRGLIWKQTGWFQGAEGRWRFEIPDTNATMSYPGMRDLAAEDLMEHPELYKAYPRLRNVLFSSRLSPGSEGTQWSQYEIGLSKDAAKTTSVPLHEMQHVIQDIEDFSKGANPTSMKVALFNKLKEAQAKGDARVAGWTDENRKKFAAEVEKSAQRLYERHAGEVEARNVERRSRPPAAKLSNAQLETLSQLKTQQERDKLLNQWFPNRKWGAPWETEDTPIEQQIVENPADIKSRFGKMSPAEQKSLLGQIIDGPPSAAAPNPGNFAVGKKMLSDTLDNFDKGQRNAWVQVPESGESGQGAYLRNERGPDGSRILTIANLRFEDKGTGAFTAYLNHLEQEAAKRGYSGVKVENLENHRLAHSLIHKHDFEVQGVNMGMPTLFKSVDRIKNWVKRDWGKYNPGTDT